MWRENKYSDPATISARLLPVTRYLARLPVASIVRAKHAVSYWSTLLASGFGGGPPGGSSGIGVDSHNTKLNYDG